MHKWIEMFNKLAESAKQHQQQPAASAVTLEVEEDIIEDVYECYEENTTGLI